MYILSITHNLCFSDIPIFGLLTKTDLVDMKDPAVQKHEKEFLECLGIDSVASYSQWKNSSSGDFSSGVIYFLDKLLSPGTKPVLDDVFCLKLAAGEMYENPGKSSVLFLIFVISFSCLFYWSNPFFMHKYLGWIL